MEGFLLAGAGDALSGDPRRQQMVGVVGEVVADQHVEQGGVALQMGLGEDDQLPLTGAGGQVGRTGEVASVTGEHRRGDEDGSRGRGRSQGEDLARGARVAADEAVQEGDLFGGHVTRVGEPPDGVLTAG
jgi:hypothetical protein